MSRRRDDRGEIAANTIVFVAVLALFFMVVQFGIVFAARQTAHSAARQALDVARLEQGTATEGEAVALEFLAGTNALQDVEVTVERGAETVSVTVTGQAWSPSPMSVTVSMTAPVERIIE